MMIDADILIQALADRTRLRALVLLTDARSLCVCELTAALNVSQPKMSRHLAALRALGVVADARIANRVFYRRNPHLPDWAANVIDALAESMRGTPERAAIARRLDGFPNRPRQRPDSADDPAAARARQDNDHAV
jgi:ArsR family transcriptional regulator, arsenate/arsenite/antimonite-responsive transcriptional repressor